jgi:hypothetical protein
VGVAAIDVEVAGTGVKTLLEATGTGEQAAAKRENRQTLSRMLFENP